MIRIDGLEPSKHIKGRYLLRLSDSTLLKVTEEEVVRHSLFPGKMLEAGDLLLLKREAGLSNAKALAASVISHRPLSRKELLQRLSEKGIDEENASAAADWLEELGALDDCEYGKTVVRHYSGRGYGKKKIEAELYRRGVPKDLWHIAMLEAQAPEDSISAFLEQKLRGKDTSDPKVLRRVSDALLRRGFSWSQVKEGLQAWGAEAEAEDY